MGSFALSKSVRDSLLVHALLLLATVAYIKVAPTVSMIAPVTPNQETVWIEVDPKSEMDTKNQMVQTLPGQEVKDPVKDAFLGEKTQVVDRQETRTAPSIGDLKSNSVKTSESEKPKMAAQKKPAMQASPLLPSLDQLGVKLPEPMKTAQEEIREAIREEEGSMTGQAGGEYVKGFKEGERTLLNTKEYVFYGYFQRIRKSLDRAWDRTLKSELEKYFKRGRQLASETDYVTQLMVFLDQNGQIKKIRILGQSGTQDLDDAAIKAFNKAGPFPNPPKGLVDSSGQVKIRWDFVLRT